MPSMRAHIGRNDQPQRDLADEMDAGHGGTGLRRHADAVRTAAGRTGPARVSGRYRLSGAEGARAAADLRAAEEAPGAGGPAAVSVALEAAPQADRAARR